MVGMWCKSVMRGRSVVQECNAWSVCGARV